MDATILVVTPESSFGEYISQNLTETGSFRIHTAKGKADALLTAENEGCKMALLDMELGEKAMLEISHSLRSLIPNLDLVILADEDLPPAMDEIRPWVLLRKPFYAPDFIQLISAVPVVPDEEILDTLEELNKSENIVEKKSSSEQSPEALEIPWLNDVSKAAQHLTRLTLESSAQAALITREEELWAYAGQLSQDAANELASTVSRHWDGQKGNDLLRFVRLASTKAEHMLFASSMTTDVILALVFDAETPFSTIRSQANKLAHSLAIAKPGPFEPEGRVPVSNGEQVQGESEADQFDESTGELDIPSIAEILDEIPSPSPPEHANSDISQSAGATLPSTPISQKFTQGPSTESSQAFDLTDITRVNETVNQQNSLTDISEELAATVPSKVQGKRPVTPIQRPAPGELDETIPHSIAESVSRMGIEPASAAMAKLNYACLLVPRFTAHYLTGDLADGLSEWMPTICVAFGWRLEFLAVRPEYLQWIINVAPNTSPGELMRTMREQSSEKIFTNIPRLKRDNPSGDFWAPGYLIMGGIQPHPPQLVRDFIKQTRQRQGISQPRR